MYYFGTFPLSKPLSRAAVSLLECGCNTSVCQAAVLAAEDLSLLPKGKAGGLVGVLDVGGRSAQFSIVDVFAEVSAITGSFSSRLVALHRASSHSRCLGWRISKGVPMR